MDITKESENKKEIPSWLLVLGVAIILILLLLCVNLYNTVNNIDYCVVKNTSINDSFNAELPVIDLSDDSQEEIVEDMGINVTYEEELMNITLEDNSTKNINIS